MGYVDLVDCDNVLEVLSWPQVIKWCNNGFLVILDFILVNGHVAWNMSVDLSGIIWDYVNSSD